MVWRGERGEGRYQFGFEYWFSLELARTWSSGAGAARETALNATMAEMREVVNCIFIEFVMGEVWWMLLVMIVLEESVGELRCFEVILDED